jgi:16S rRNA (guanine527-N7)-methyltransferase
MERNNTSNPSHSGHPAPLPPAAAAQLEAFLALLLRWNTRINLTAVRDPGSIVRRHFAESLFAAELIPASGITLLDFGSGAGFPGIPIAIARPEIAVTLAESQGRKAAFLREAVRTLGLRAEVWAGRVERMPVERIFDAVTLRAVDKMPHACQVAVPRLAAGGWLAVFTTRATESALDRLPGIRWSEALLIPGSRQEILRTGLRDDSARS